MQGNRILTAGDKKISHELREFREYTTTGQANNNGNSKFRENSEETAFILLCCFRVRVVSCRFS